MDIGCLHFDAARLSSALVRYLKMEGVVGRLRAFANRLVFAAHLVSPLSCVELGYFRIAIWLWCGAIVALALSRGSIFVCGATCE